MEQIARLNGRLRYTSARRLSPTEATLCTDPVACFVRVWFIHDIDPIQAQYECKRLWPFKSARGLFLG